MYMCGSGAQTEQNRSVPHTHTHTKERVTQSWWFSGRPHSQGCAQHKGRAGSLGLTLWRSESLQEHQAVLWEPQTLQDQACQATAANKEELEPSQHRSLIVQGSQEDALWMSLVLYLQAFQGLKRQSLGMRGVAASCWEQHGISSGIKRRYFREYYRELSQN